MTNDKTPNNHCIINMTIIELQWLPFRFLFLITVSVITFYENPNIGPRFYNSYFENIPIIGLSMAANAICAHLYLALLSGTPCLAGPDMVSWLLVVTLEYDLSLSTWSPLVHTDTSLVTLYISFCLSDDLFMLS